MTEAQHAKAFGTDHNCTSDTTGTCTTCYRPAIFLKILLQSRWMTPTGDVAGFSSRQMIWRRRLKERKSLFRRTRRPMVCRLHLSSKTVARSSSSKNITRVAVCLAIFSKPRRSLSRTAFALRGPLSVTRFLTKDWACTRAANRSLSAVPGP